MEGLKMIPYIALIITIAGVILGASVITLSKFGETVDAVCYNATYVYNESLDQCASWVNESLTDITATDNFTAEYFAIDQSIEGEVTIAEQQPTVAIIAVMVIIISIIAGVFVYMRYFG